MLSGNETFVCILSVGEISVNAGGFQVQGIGDVIDAGGKFVSKHEVVGCDVASVAKGDAIGKRVAAADDGLAAVVDFLERRQGGVTGITEKWTAANIVQDCAVVLDVAVCRARGIGTRRQVDAKQSAESNGVGINYRQHADARPRRHRIGSGRADCDLRIPNRQRAAGIVVEVETSEGGRRGDVGAGYRVGVCDVARVADLKDAGDALLRINTGGGNGFFRGDCQGCHRKHGEGYRLGDSVKSCPITFVGRLSPVADHGACGSGISSEASP